MNGNQLVSTKSKPTMIPVLVFSSCNEPGLEIVRSLVDQLDIEAHGVCKIMEVNAGPGGAIGIFRYAGVTAEQLQVNELMPAVRVVSTGTLGTLVQERI
jgi:hypothetical protein